METLTKQYVEKSYDNILFSDISGRWITLQHIEELLLRFSDQYNVTVLGTSEENRSIYKLSLGTGKKKILIWTQMHGNESTGTKAVCDLLNFLSNDSDAVVKAILTNCTIHIIPILNPDGAEKYTRVNANEVDLNRDAVDLSAKESILLRKELDTFQPDFCFNLHDQRTIFGVEGTKNPATLSFLAPSEEISRSITTGRKKTMNVIIAMNALMQQIIPNHIGRYTDEFYPTATGDNFQKLGYSTILIESGHYPNDYEREICRKYTFMSLLQGIYHITTSDNFSDYETYFEIPNNSKDFYDLKHTYANKADEIFQFSEVLQEGKITFVPELVTEIENSSPLFHKEIVFES